MELVRQGLPTTRPTIQILRGLPMVLRSRFTSLRDGNYEVYAMNADGTGQTRQTNNAAYDSDPSWSGYLPRTPKTLIGSGGALGTAAAGFLFGQKGDAIASVVAFDTSTAGSRAGARVSSQSAPFNDQGTNLLFSITTSAGLASVTFAPVSEKGTPGIAVAPTIPAGSTGALVSFNATTGKVSSGASLRAQTGVRRASAATGRRSRATSPRCSMARGRTSRPAERDPSRSTKKQESSCVSSRFHDLFTLFTPVNP